MHPSSINMSGQSSRQTHQQAAQTQPMQSSVLRKNSLSTRTMRQGQSDNRSGHSSQGSGLLTSLGNFFNTSTSQGQQMPGQSNTTQRRSDDRRETISVEDYVHRLKQTIKQLEGDNRLLQTHIHGLESDVQTLQEKKFRALDDPRFPPLEDSYVHNEISNIQQDISQIGRRYCTSTTEKLETLSREEQANLVNELRNIWIMPRDSAPISELMQSRLLRRLCLTGLLSYALHCACFDNPFFIMKGLLKDPDSVERDESIFAAEQDWSTIFLNLWKSANRSDPREANMWRSQTLRYLDSSPDQLPKLPEDDRSKMKWAKGDACRKAASEICKRPTTLMLVHSLEGDEAQSFQQEVTAVFDRASDLAMRLWKQRPYVRVLGHAKLPSIKYSVDSSVLQTHSAHIQDDPMDRSLDGKPVKIVVHPAVQAQGTHEAEDYATARIWAKAVVLLET